MNELMKKNLNDKLCLVKRDKDFERKVKLNNAINEDLMESVREILRCYVDGLQNKFDIIGYRNTLNYVIKTCRVKYDGRKKVERLSKVIEGMK
ncbi:MAG TPA: hypothetical protein VLL98_06195 [Rickettsiales bacterium]|nr:hypothetical protein [Rickettsiales bacterium]